MNEKLKNGEELSASDFRSLDELPILQETKSGKNEEDLQEFRTERLPKYVSRGDESPALFSSLMQDYESPKGTVTSSDLFCWR